MSGLSLPSGAQELPIQLQTSDVQLERRLRPWPTKCVLVRIYDVWENGIKFLLKLSVIIYCLTLWFYAKIKRWGCVSREASQILCCTEASWIYKLGTIINLGSDHATKVGRLNETGCQCWSWLRSVCRVDRVEDQEVSLQHSTKLLGSATHLSITQDFPALCNKDKNLWA